MKLKLAIQNGISLKYGIEILFATVRCLYMVTV